MDANKERRELVCSVLRRQNDLSMSYLQYGREVESLYLA